MNLVEEYCEEKVNVLKSWLSQMATKGHPKYFEILVDGLKVIHKTDNLNEFDQYSSWINDTTKSMRVMVYNTKNSHRSQVFEYHTENYIDGVSDKLYATRKRRLNEDEIEVRVQQAVEEREKEQAVTDLKKENQRLVKRLGDAEAHIRKLEESLEEKKGGSDEFNFNSMLNMASVVAQNNPEIKKQLGDLGLDGLIHTNKPEEKVATQENEQPTATFRRKGSKNEQAAPQQKEEELIPVGDDELSIRVPNSKLDDEMGLKLFDLVHFLSQNPDYIDVIHDLINEEKQKVA